MKRYLLFTLLILSLSYPAEALITYDLEIKDDIAYVNTTLLLDTEKSTDIWDIELILPENSEIINLEDEEKIQTYTFRDNKLQFKSNRDSYKFTETINVQFKINSVVQEEYNGIKFASFSLFGFPDEYTKVEISAPNVNSGEFSLGFTEEFTSTKAKGYGKGPVNVKLLYNVADNNKYENYITYSNLNLEDADLLFGLVPLITGRNSPFEKFVVIALNDNEFDQNIDPWSDGKYKEAGLIIIRNSVKENDLGPLVLHETTHGFNQKVLKWDRSDVTWFNEGVAKYIEWVAAKKLDKPKAEIFGEDVTYANGLNIHRLPSRSNSEELWNYYHKSNNKFMYTWNPERSEYREFGYAFGELMVRKYIQENGPSALHQIYNELDKIDTPIEDPYERTNKILEILDSDFKPCYSRNQVDFEACLDDINNQEVKIPEKVTLKSKVYEDEFIDDILLSHAQKQIEDESIFDKIIRAINELINSILN
jgi:hypothetical protein